MSRIINRKISILNKLMLPCIYAKTCTKITGVHISNNLVGMWMLANKIFKIDHPDFGTLVSQYKPNDLSELDVLNGYCQPSVLARELTVLNGFKISENRVWNWIDRNKIESLHDGNLGMIVKRGTITVRPYKGKIILQ